MSDDRFEEKPMVPLSETVARIREYVNQSRPSLQRECGCGGVGFHLSLLGPGKGHTASACRECNVFPDDAAAQSAAMKVMGSMTSRGVRNGE